MTDPGSSYAIEGTAAHTVTEWCRMQGVRAEHFLGATLQVKTAGRVVPVVCDQGMVDSVNSFLDYVYDLGGEWFAELRVSYDRWVPKGFGTSDHVALLDVPAHDDPSDWLKPGAICYAQDGVEIHVVDFKHGEGVRVDAKDNSQLMLYALGFLHDYLWLIDKPINGIWIHVAQPRLGNYQKVWISYVDLINWADTVIVEGAKRTEDPDAPFKAGEWCQFCLIKKRCKTRAQSLMDKALEDGDFLDIDAAERQTRNLLTNEELATIRPYLKQIKAWVEDINRTIEAELMQGRAVGKLKLVAGRSSRQFIGSKIEVEAEIRDAAENGAELELHEPAVLKSVAVIESLVGKKLFAQAYKTEGGKERPAGKLAHLIRKSEGKPTVAEGDDPRPAVTVDVTKEFDDLDASQTETIFDT